MPQSRTVNRRGYPQLVLAQLPLLHAVVNWNGREYFDRSRTSIQTPAYKPSRDTILKPNILMPRQTHTTIRRAVRKSGRVRYSRAKRRAAKPARRVAQAGTVRPALARHRENPVIEPNPDVSWESKATFNPAALFDAGKVHLLYRAIGDSDVSVLGHASSEDGRRFERSKAPAYQPREAFEGVNPGECRRTGRLPYFSGGGGRGGCEDPRLAQIGDRVYLIFTAFNGWDSIRIALTSIGVDDFRSQRWNWAKPVLISPPGEIHKNWVLFPEKIGGKYAILHSISPEILVEYFENLDDFDGEKHIASCPGNRVAPAGCRDLWLRGAGPTPIKTKNGWLLLCQVMDTRDPNRYKLGAMILDADDPTKVLYRSKTPILEPDEVYENEGWKAGVIYSCGAVVKDGELIVYYGGADRVVCAASAPLEQFLSELVGEGVPELKKLRISSKKSREPSATK